MMPKVGDVVLDRFELEEELGKGGFGVVYKARQRSLDQPVAIKLLRPKVLANEDVLQRFNREVDVAKALTHPNTIRILDHGTTSQGLPFYIMEYVKGRSLRDALNEDGPLGEERTAHIVDQMLKSLAEAHSKGVIHRDLKPANIMLCDVFGEQDFVKVLDFGIAKALCDDGGSVTKTGIVLGSPPYMSPEQTKGRRNLDRRSDLYAVGLMAAECLVGRPILEGQFVEVLTLHVSGQPLPFPPRVTNSPLWPVIQRASMRNRDERYQDAMQMRQALAEVSGTGGSSLSFAPPAPAPVQVSGVERRPAAETPLPDETQLERPTHAHQQEPSRPHETVPREPPPAQLTPPRRRMEDYPPSGHGTPVPGPPPPQPAHHTPPPSMATPPPHAYPYGWGDPRWMAHGPQMVHDPRLRGPRVRSRGPGRAILITVAIVLVLGLIGVGYMIYQLERSEAAPTTADAPAEAAAPVAEAAPPTAAPEAPQSPSTQEPPSAESPTGDGAQSPPDPSTDQAALPVPAPPSVDPNSLLALGASLALAGNTVRSALPPSHQVQFEGTEGAQIALGERVLGEIPTTLTMPAIDASISLTFSRDGLRPETREVHMASAGTVMVRLRSRARQREVAEQREPEIEPSDRDAPSEELLRLAAEARQEQVAETHDRTPPPVEEEPEPEPEDEVVLTPPPRTPPRTSDDGRRGEAPSPSLRRLADELEQ